jgi:hypothetical protein
MPKIQLALKTREKKRGKKKIKQCKKKKKQTKGGGGGGEKEPRALHRLAKSVSARSRSKGGGAFRPISVLLQYQLASSRS